MNWHTETRKISELKNWESNPRVISEESYEELKESIGSLGNFEPLVINIDGTVLAGNQRLRVAKERGDKEVEVSVPERELTEQEIKKIGIISNRHSGEWDMDKLANEFEDILEELGFDDLLPEVKLEVKEDDYEEPEELSVTVKTGEVWALGEHRLLCGDSTSKNDVDLLMNGQSAQMVFTDPPYNIAYEGMAGKKRKAIANDKMSTEEFRQFLAGALSNVVRYTVGSFYVCMSSQELHTLREVMDSLGVVWKSYIVWVKDRFGLSGADYQRQFEPIVYGMKNEYFKELESIGGGEEEGEVIYYGKNGKEYYGGRKQSDVWLIPKPKISKEHPTIKPIKLCAKAVLNSSQVGDIVLDTFGGSGSTLIACEQTNRKCYMMELDPHYASVIADRWEKLTGKEAIKLE